MEVRLNVYDLHPKNESIYWLGFGIFHSGVEVNGLEFAYGGHPEDSSGVYTHEPTRPIPNVVVPVRTRIVMGVTHVSRADVDAIARELGSEFLGSEYHILRRNCNTFSDEFCKRLLGVGIPGFVNRLAFLAAQVECLLPMDRILGTVTVPVEQPSNDLEQAWETTAHRLSSEEVTPVIVSDEDRRRLLAQAAQKRQL